MIRKKKTSTWVGGHDVKVFDALLEKFQKITSKMKHIERGDEEIGQKLLRLNQLKSYHIKILKVRMD